MYTEEQTRLICPLSPILDKRRKSTVVIALKTTMLNLRFQGADFNSLLYGTRYTDILHLNKGRGYF